MRARHSILALMLMLLAACSNGSAPPVLLDSTGHRLATEGKWLLVNYWATWCKPCRAEVPDLNLLHRELASHNVMVLGYNFDQLEGDALLDAGQQLGIEFPLLSINAAGQLSLPGVTGIPVTFLVSPDGKYHTRLTGEQTRASLLTVLQESGAIQPPL